MKHIILIILLTLGVWGQEVGVPYVQRLSDNIYIWPLFNIKDGNTILMRDSLKNIRIFDLNSEKLNKFNTDVNVTIPMYVYAIKNNIYIAQNDKIKITDIDSVEKERKLYLPMDDGREQRVSALYVNQDQQFMLTGTDHNHIYLWNLRNFVIDKIFRGSDYSPYAKYEGYPHFENLHGHIEPVTSLSLIDNKYILSGSAYKHDQTLRKWDINSTSELNVIKNIKPIKWMWISKDNKYFVPHLSDGNLSIYDVQEMKEIRRFVNNDSIVGYVISPDEKRLYTSSKNDVLQEWNMDTGAEIKRIDFNSPITSILMTKNAKYLVVGGLNQVKFWNIKEMKEVISLYLIKNNEWILMTPKGYFINSKNDSNVILIKDKDGSERPLNCA